MFERYKLAKRDRHKLAERLKDHAEIYLIASALYSDDNVSSDFDRLAQACLQVATTLNRLESEAIKPETISNQLVR